MSLNLLNRILTSIILLVILFIALSLNNFICLYLLIITSMISYYEFFNLIKKKFKKEKNKIYLSNIISFLYLSFFTLVSYDLYVSSSITFTFVILICIFSDIGGYVIGKLIGGRKLTKLSPKKTVAGSFGSFIFSLLPIIIYSLIFNSKLQSADYFVLILICLFLSLVCQLGDLLISFFKRKAKVKDTGSILPGHGGLLDRIDGIIFVLPVAYVLDKLF